MCTRHHSEMLIQSVIAGLTRHDFASYNNVQLVREIHVIRRRTNELALFPSSKHLLQVRNGPSKKKMHFKNIALLQTTTPQLSTWDKT